jgi:hypothetical protein
MAVRQVDGGVDWDALEDSLEVPGGVDAQRAAVVELIWAREEHLRAKAARPPPPEPEPEPAMPIVPPGEQLTNADGDGGDWWALTDAKGRRWVQAVLPLAACPLLILAWPASAAAPPDEPLATGGCSRRRRRRRSATCAVLSSPIDERPGVWYYARYYANCRTQEVQWEAPPLPPTANEALLSAAAAGDVAALVAACARGADVAVAVNAHGDAALAVASAYGHTALVRT